MNSDLSKISFVVSLPHVKVMSSQQCIGFGMLFARDIVEGKMKICEFREPLSLLAIELLWLSKVSKVLMIGPDLEGMCCAHKVMSPFRKGDHDHEHFSIINFVIALHRIKGLGEISNQFPYTILSLRKDSTNCEFRCISLHTEWIIICRNGEDWSGGDKSFDPFKGFLLFGFPNPRVISGEAGEWASNSRVTLNKMAIKVAKP